MDNYVSYIRKMIGSKPMFLVGAGVVVSDEKGRILLIKRTDNGKWGLPGGSLELGETFEEAAAREILEEAGLTVSNLVLFKVYSGKKMHFIYPNGDEVYNAVCIFMTNEYKGTATADGIESSSIAFFGFGDLPSDLHPPDMIIIDDYGKALRANGK
jgi:8-oxo-dGTP pyrophosphatase MutT (NUDIX family)